MRNYSNKSQPSNGPVHDPDSTRATLAYLAVWLFVAVTAGAYIDHLSGLFHQGL